MATEKIYNSCREALERVQTFDPETLGRVDDLGRQMNFAEAVKPAEAIIAVYKRIPMSALPDFTDSQLNAILAQANADYNVFKQILDFNAASGDAVGTRTNILNNIKVRRDQLFDQLWQYVAYGVARITDTSLLETQARATIQGIETRQRSSPISSTRRSQTQTMRCRRSEPSHQSKAFRSRPSISRTKHRPKRHWQTGGSPTRIASLLLWAASRS